MSIGAPRGIAYSLHKLVAMAWLLVGRMQRAKLAFGRMLARWPDDAYALSSRAHLLAQAGQADAAIADAQRLVQVHPKRSAADWFNLAFLLERANRLAEAEAAFRGALDLDDQLDRAWYGLGVTLVRLGRLDDAVVALKRNTKLQPMSPYGWYQLAQVHVAREHTEEARRVIRHLKGFEPKVAAQLERETGLAA
jgi:tetratricopeptide (TPR) repeat protein